jgi:hypothetical protein
MAVLAAVVRVAKCIGKCPVPNIMVVKCSELDDDLLHCGWIVGYGSSVKYLTKM